ncbi:hypothetical protein K2W90_05665 [Candidatus Babeliales bacterium]|nr:hypothetical protein [Candidatus Babeliales bacterium]
MSMMKRNKGWGLFLGLLILLAGLGVTNVSAAGSGNDTKSTKEQKKEEQARKKEEQKRQKEEEQARKKEEQARKKEEQEKKKEEQKRQKEEEQARKKEEQEKKKQEKEDKKADKDKDKDNKDDKNKDDKNKDKDKDKDNKDDKNKDDKDKDKDNKDDKKDNGKGSILGDLKDKVKGFWSGTMVNLEKERAKREAEWARNRDILNALPEGTVIAIKTNKKGPGKGKFIAVVDGKYLKPVHDSIKKVKADENAQFKVLRSGHFFGLQQVAAPQNNLQSVKDTFEVSFENKNFDDAQANPAHWMIEVTGSLKKQVWFKNLETGGYLSVRDPKSDKWSNDGRLFTRDQRVMGEGKAQPAQKMGWETFSIEIIKSVAAQATEQAQTIDTDAYPFKEGNIVALRSHPKGSGKGRYLNIVDGKYLSSNVQDSGDQNSRFKVLRKGYWVGFQRLTDPKFNLQSSPVVQAGDNNPEYSVQFQNANFLQWEYWQPVQDGEYWTFKNEATDGFLTIPGEKTSWAKGRVWTRGKKNSPAQNRTNNEKFIVEVIEDTGIVREEPKPAVVPVVPATPGATTPPVPVVTPPVLSEEDKEKQRLQLEKDIAGVVPTPRDTAALQSLKAGTVVAIKVAGSAHAGRYLRLEDGQHLMPTGLNAKDPKSQFVVMRLGNWIGFKSYQAAGGILQATPKTHEVSFTGDEFQKDESTDVHWALVPEQDGSLGVVQLHNQASGGFLNVLSPAALMSGIAMTADLSGVIAGLSDIERLATSKDLKGRAATQDLATTKFAIEIIQSVGAETTAGAQAFTYIPELYQQRTPAYHENWKFAEAGYGWVKFQARALEGIAIALSAAMNPANGPTYEVQIGLAGNTKSAIMDAGKSVFEVSSDVAGNQDADVSGGLPLEGQAWDDYWVMFDEQGKVSAGKGTEVGKRSFIEWKDATPATDVRYVGFSDLASRAEFKNITFSPARPVAPKLIVPAGFTKEESEPFVKVTIGSYQDQLDAWALDKDGKLYHREAGSLSGDNWVAAPAKGQDGKDLGKIKDVEVGDDGVVHLIADSGQVYTFIRSGQKMLPAPRENRGPVVPVPATVVVKPALDVKALEEKVVQKEEARGKVKNKKEAKKKKDKLARKKPGKKGHAAKGHALPKRKPLKKAKSLKEQRNKNKTQK